MSFVIITDTSANLPTPLLREHGIAAIPFTYIRNGEDLTCTDTESFADGDFYAAMRGGEQVTTSQITPFRYEEAMDPYLQDGKDILLVGMSSGISGAYNMAEFTASELREKYPERTIALVDTYGASLGEGFFVLKAIECREKGMSITETAEYLLSERAKMVQIFMVDDIKYLLRSGRLYKVLASVGSLLQVKPLLKGNEEGHIVAYSIARNREKALEALAKKYDKLVKNAGEQMIGIAHADCAEDAARLAELLRRNNPPKDIMTVVYEPVTGSHVGPGTIALFFMGETDARSK